MREEMHGKLDFHMHSIVSDGTERPEDLVNSVRDAGITIFSLTDHDAIKGGAAIQDLLSQQDMGLQFVPGVEFSCRDEEGKYHILGYGYDAGTKPIQDVVDLGHSYRMEKVKARLDYIDKEFGFSFPEEEIQALFALDNPGKPHIGNMMVKYGYAENKQIAIKEYINKLRIKSQYVRPEEAIAGILGSGGIPVLAHPFYGDGDQLILGEEMEERLKRLMGFGLRGVEAFYSGFSEKLREQMLALADKYDLYVTAGSDYHGTNKLVQLGDTGMEPDTPLPAGMERFLRDANMCLI